MKIKAIIFDMDDTLFYEKDYIQSGLKAVGKWFRKKFDINNFYEIAIDLFNSGERTLVFNKTLDALNYKYDDTLIKELIGIYRSHEPNISLYHDAAWVLENLDYSVKLGLISDGYLIAQQRKVEALKLNERFHAIILSDSFGRNNWKPSFIPYQQACFTLNCLPEECVYVGDNLQKDFISAKELGWTTVHIMRDEGVYSDIKLDTKYHAHYQISSLIELADIMELNHLFINNKSR